MEVKKLIIPLNFSTFFKNQILTASFLKAEHIFLKEKLLWSY